MNIRTVAGLTALLTLMLALACSRPSGAPEHEGHAQTTPTATPTDPHAGHRRAPSGQPAPPPSSGDHAGHAGGHAEPPGEVGGTPTGYAAFTLDRARAEAVGLRTAPVEERTFHKALRTTGYVVLDETRTAHVHSKVRGWIERVNVDFVGKRVAAGTPLCTIYSQEVLAAELEFISVLDQVSRPGLPGSLGAAEAEARTRLVEAARRRLALWDVPPQEIERLEKTREPSRTFTLVSPRAGIVLSRQALPGMFIDPSLELYVVSDVTKLWLLADVYERDAPWVKLGAPANLQVEGLTNPRQARVSFIPPTLEEATRTLKVRFDLDNPDGALRPGAFATVEMHADLGSSLAIPEESVIHAGREDIVFVVTGELIEARAVKLGPLVDAYYRVERGLRAGEAVVVGAQFLIDSESRLRASLGKGPGHAGH